MRSGLLAFLAHKRTTAGSAEVAAKTDRSAGKPSCIGTMLIPGGRPKATTTREKAAQAHERSEHAGFPSKAPTVETVLHRATTTREKAAQAHGRSEHAGFPSKAPTVETVLHRATTT